MTLIFFDRLVPPAVVAAHLTGQSLAGADLADVDLAGVDLTGANLAEAVLAGANLTDAYLTRANLTDAYLADVDLTGANLAEAELAGTCLAGACLAGANLAGTCLDPAAVIPPVTDDEISAAGLEVVGDRVYGWRAARSQHCGSTDYALGTTHRAPWFSVSATECHPGIYLAGLAWMRRGYPDAPLVRVSCRRRDLHRAGNKWRAREIRVEDVL